MRSPHTYRRKNSLRLHGYDYSGEGVYFITCITKNRVKVFGEVKADTVLLSQEGTIVKQEWLKTSKIRKEITLGEFVVMPDHFHALCLIDGQQVRAHGHAPRQNQKRKHNFGPQSKNLSALIRSFKATCTKRIRETNPSFAWQRGFHDRIVRNEKELERIAEYIYNNPLKHTLQTNLLIMYKDIPSYHVRNN
ncbi:MAG: transposase [Balneolales bacterium]|nr:transposase [Balneolales bacterium]